MAGNKTEMVKEALVRYIVDQKLESGDKLPSQNELRLKLNVGSTTISSALKALEEDNVVELRDKVGVFIKKGGLDGHTGRNVGILVNVSNSIYNHILVSRLQKYLQDENCNNMIFSCPADKDSKKLKNFPGLLRHIRQEKITNILITCELFEDEFDFLDRSGINYLSTINTGERPCCNIDMQQYLKDAFTYVVRHGAKRPALLSRGRTIESKLGKAFDKLIKTLNAEWDYRDFYYINKSFMHSKEVVTEILSMDAAERPDAFIFAGDVVMQGVYTWLYRLQAGVKEPYMPVAAVIMNKQNPLMPLVENAATFELDIFEQAKTAVDLLLQADRSQTKAKSATIPARLVSQETYFENSITCKNVDD